MAKAKTRATLSPDKFAFGQAILTEDVQTVIGAQGYVQGEVVETLAAGHGYVDLSDNEPSLLQGPAVTMRSFEAWIPPHAQSLVVEVEISLSSGSTATGEVEVTVGGAAALGFSRAGAAAAQPASQSVATSSTGTGWQLVEVVGEVTSGTDALAALESLRIECEPIDAIDLPDPPVE